MLLHYFTENSSFLNKFFGVSKKGKGKRYRLRSLSKEERKSPRRKRTLSSGDMSSNSDRDPDILQLNIPMIRKKSFSGLLQKPQLLKANLGQVIDFRGKVVKPKQMGFANTTKPNITMGGSYIGEHSKDTDSQFLKLYPKVINKNQSFQAGYSRLLTLRGLFNKTSKSSQITKLLTKANNLYKDYELRSTLRSN